MILDFTIPQAPVLKPLLTPQQFHDYQKKAELHQLYHDDSMLWLGMGLGKTVITLSTIVDRMRAGQVKKTLIFGPLRVIQSVWEKEARKWSHTKHLTFSVIHGTAVERKRKLFAEADVYLCNYENMNWLAQELTTHYISADRPLPFEAVVYDEVSKMKNSTTMRFAGGIVDKVDRKKQIHKIKKIGWRKFINQFKYRMGLTGTPASNGYLDLFGQFLAVDGGQRLGEFITHYKDAYFTSDYMGYDYQPSENGKQWIEHHIADITLKMDSRDYLDMPDAIETNIMVDLPAKARKHYNEIENNLFTELDTGSSIELFSKSSVSNKLLQICNGQPYVNMDDEQGAFDTIHNAKLDALEDVIEEAAGSPVLCSYSFVSDAKRIMKKFKHLKPVNLTDTKARLTGKVIDDWNSGKIKLLIGHPASMGHGIDELQQSGSTVVWFGINWSLELYEQMNARIDRQGQTSVVKIIRILCKDTVDLAVADAISRKTDDQQGLKAALQRYRDGITTNELELSFI